MLKIFYKAYLELSKYSKQSTEVAELAELTRCLIHPELYPQRADVLAKIVNKLEVIDKIVAPFQPIFLVLVNLSGSINAYLKTLPRQLANPILNLRMLLSYFEYYYPEAVMDIKSLKKWVYHPTQYAPYLLQNCQDTPKGLKVLRNEASHLIQLVIQQQKTAIHKHGLVTVARITETENLPTLEFKKLPVDITSPRISGDAAPYVLTPRN